MINKLIRADYKSLIFEFRGFKVMVDFDLSKLYGVETKRLKEQVKRNINRFPSDFMFELLTKKKNNWLQFVTGWQYLNTHRFVRWFLLSKG